MIGGVSRVSVLKDVVAVPRELVFLVGQLPLEEGGGGGGGVEAEGGPVVPVGGGGSGGSGSTAVVPAGREGRLAEAVGAEAAVES